MGIFDLLKKKTMANNQNSKPTSTIVDSYNVPEVKKGISVFPPTGNELLDGLLEQIGEKEPQYKIDLLKESIALGHEIDPFYLIKSSEEKELPYFCECETEYHLFHDHEKPILKGNITSICNLFYSYRWEEIKHPSKILYWQNYLIQKAEYGNREAQAILCCTNNSSPFAFDDNKEEIIQHYKDLYEKHLMEDAEQGNAYAQLAVGIHLTPHHSEEKEKWLKLAGEQGLGDAHYYLAKHYESLCYDYDSPRFGEIEDKGRIAVLKGMAMEHYLQAAKLDNGTMVAYCQYYVAMWYEDGDGYFAKDMEKAKYWYKKALENGNERAKWHLE